MQKIPELLSPAGSRASLEAAVEAGADAVYLGADRYNARMRADNFSGEDMRGALSLCRAYGVKTYVTLNTRLFDDELEDAVRLAAELYEQGVSALIVADMGLARLIKEHIPSLDIHASTQLSGHSAEDARELCRQGFSRMVCQREITKDELFLLCKNSPIEIEMFVHGAHCVSFSGQCLMSAVMGGRSGNRGECAQPCRQPYYQNGKKCYPISLRDMCLAGHITEIIASGAASLKIEGRQKSPEYVYGVTKIYRTLLDEGRNAREEEIKALDALFSRGGFTDGYFKGDHRNMQGVRTMEAYLESENEAFTGLKRKVPLDVSLTVTAEKPAVLTVKSPFRCVTVADAQSADANLSPLTEEGAKKSVSRLGNTPFELRDFQFVSDEKAPLTLSALNKMRRQAVEQLMKADREGLSLSEIKLPKEKTSYPQIRTAEFLFADRISATAREFFDKIYLPHGVKSPDLPPEKAGTALPPYLTCPSDEKLWQGTAQNVLVHSAAQLSEAKSRGKCAGVSLRGNIFNSAAAEYYGSLGADFVTMAPEVRLSKIRDAHVSCPCGAVVYGRLPLMLCVRCAISDGGKNCHGKKEKLCTSQLCDRRRIAFPVVGLPDCTNVIYNSVPIYAADKQDEIQRAGVSVFHFIFTDESAEQVDEIINAYKNGIPPKSKNIRRIQ